MRSCPSCNKEQAVTPADETKIRFCRHVAFVFQDEVGALYRTRSVLPTKPIQPDWAAGWEQDASEDIPGIITQLTAAGYEGILLRRLTVIADTESGPVRISVTAGYLNADRTCTVPRRQRWRPGRFFDSANAAA